MEESVPLTEPVIVTATFLTGLSAEFADDWVRITAWEQLPAVNGEMGERRIVGRWVMPKATARDLYSQMRKGLSVRHDQIDH